MLFRSDGPAQRIGVKRKVVWSVKPKFKGGWVPKKKMKEAATPMATRNGHRTTGKADKFQGVNVTFKRHEGIFLIWGKGPTQKQTQIGIIMPKLYMRRIELKCNVLGLGSFEITVQAEIFKNLDWVGELVQEWLTNGERPNVSQADKTRDEIVPGSNKQIGRAHV